MDADETNNFLFAHDSLPANLRTTPEWANWLSLAQKRHEAIEQMILLPPR